MPITRLALPLVLLLSGCGGLLTFACSASTGSAPGPARGAGGSTATPGAAGGTLFMLAIGGETCSEGGCAVGGSRPGCGDGALTQDEACDDGNSASSDGCRSDCLVVELGFSCPTPGKPCSQVAKCGDGVTTFPEFCDDGNVLAGDGCSPHCTIEIGYRCDGAPSTCSKTTCGDGVKEGSESCDDGNADPFDGCSATCQKEPNCGAIECISDCGDGLIISEECDDGNNRSGDGCSDKCKIEPGFTCASDATPPATLQLPIVYRDFRDHADPFRPHPNFHWGGIFGPNGQTTKIPKVALDREGKPEYAGVGNWHVDSQENFSTWYRPSDLSIKFVDALTMTNAAGVYRYDSSAFFPLDHRGWAADTAHPEPLFDGHNFLFTSEVHYWFRYDAAKNSLLSFRGDDDVWVFIARKLVVDLGGIHEAATGSVTLNATTTDTSGAQLSLARDKVYEIAVFQAERNPGASNYKLELTGFNANPSLCVPVCGDGILGLGEQCDDGINSGGYGKCAPGCVLTEYCGDGIVQGPEDCDDGNRIEADDCSNACRTLVVR